MKKLFALLIAAFIALPAAQAQTTIRPGGAIYDSSTGSFLGFTNMNNGREERLTATLGSGLTATSVVCVDSAKAFTSTCTSATPSFGATTATSFITSGLIDASGAAAGQIKFPATQNASSDVNTLDDYKEGTVTAALSPLTSGTITVNAAIRTLAYTKIGRMVSIQGLINVSSVSAPVGRLRITGLPYTALAGNQFEAAVTIIADTLTTSQMLVGFIANSGNFIDIYPVPTGASGGLVDTAAALIQANSNLRVNAIYYTN